ncbi:MAG: hypothetical protein M5R40_20575 [Anaerolineae bacterium]|nr:hypothetical protein [Anaerolineae bacterium]
MYAEVFAPGTHGGNDRATCSICHTEWPEELEEVEGDRVGPLCRSFREDLGKRLPSAEYLVLGIGAPSAAVDPR